MTSKPSIPPSGNRRAQPESFRASALSISLTVKDLRKSLAWYRDVLGCTVEGEHERDGTLQSVGLKAGAVRIRLNQDDGAKGWDRVKGHGFSFLLTTTQDVDAIAKGIKQRGGTLGSEPADMPWGMRLFGLQDLDGYRLAIASER
jgi:uncharacterized glyoxalase superfamily protein PhnB